MPSDWMTEETLLGFHATSPGVSLLRLLNGAFLLLTRDLRVDCVDAVDAGGLGDRLRPLGLVVDSYL